MNIQTLQTSTLASALSLAILTLGTIPALAITTPPKAVKPTIILVHGAFADGSAWQSVIPRLQKEGYRTIAVQNTLTSFEADVATTRRVIQAQEGDVVAVGHSYGGAVISAAAAGNPHVKALVFVTAFAPDVDEKIGVLYEKFGKAPLLAALVPDSAGYLSIDAAKYHDVFAKDVPEKDAAVMAAVQKPINHTAFDGSIHNPAWKTIPSWYFIAADDQAILIDLQRFMAKRIGATTVEYKTSHVPFVSKPKEVAKLILDAAASVK